MSRIACKFAKIVLVPQNAMANPLETEMFETMDGKRCRAQRVMGWDNADGRYDKELDAICRGQWGISFEYLRSLFIDRLSRIDGRWHLIKMSEA